MTQPHNKKPAATKFQQTVEYLVSEKRLTWHQAFKLLAIEQELLASPDGEFASILVGLLKS